MHIFFWLLSTVIFSNAFPEMEEEVLMKEMTAAAAKDIEANFIALAICPNLTDGVRRFQRSARVLGINLKLLGRDREDSESRTSLLVEALEKEKEEVWVLFVSSCHSIFTGPAKEVVKRFTKHYGGDGVVVLAWEEDEDHRWQRGSEQEAASISFMAKAKDSLKYLKSRNEVRVVYDYYTQLFMPLDKHDNFHMSWIRPEGYEREIFPNDKPMVLYTSVPHPAIDHVGNYMPKLWYLDGQCIACREDVIPDFDGLQEVPQVVLAVFVLGAMPLAEEFIQKILFLDYPKSHIDIFLYYDSIRHKDMILAADFTEYHSVTLLGPQMPESESELPLLLWQARNMAVEKCLKTNCDYYFSVDSDSHLDNPRTLKLLVEQNRGIISPILTQQSFGNASNFLGPYQLPDGVSRPSDNYLEITSNRRRGVFAAPLISSCYLIKGLIISSLTFTEEENSFCDRLMHQNDHLLYSSNMEDFGHLVIPVIDSKASSKYGKERRLHPELWEVTNNRLDWEKRYLHPDYQSFLEGKYEPEQPCQDVFWLPIVSDRFADEMVEEMENYGLWSDASDKDQRIIDGGVVYFPTDDIYMKQIDFEPQWLEFLNVYIKPLAAKVFKGYEKPDPPTSILSFVARFRPEGLAKLESHFDDATYTINIALNRPGDYTGGGCHFVRYNCSVTDTRKGWMMIHPGAPTHRHESIATTGGTRYILVSFVDPPSQAKHT